VTRESRPISDARFRSRTVAALALGIACAVIALDLWLYPRVRGWSIVPRSGLRLALAVACIVATRTMLVGLAPLVRWSPGHTRQWLIAGVGVLGASVVAGTLWPVRPGASIDVTHSIVRGIVVAPIVEETIYRQALMIPAVAVLGRVGAVVVSTGAFAALHVVYGNAALTNAIGGLALATMFVVTESWPSVVVAHAVGNLALLTFHVLAA
jgi:membrane protease YdiL (CAAX protease family)